MGVHISHLRNTKKYSIDWFHLKQRKSEGFYRTIESIYKGYLEFMNVEDELRLSNYIGATIIYRIYGVSRANYILPHLKGILYKIGSKLLVEDYNISEAIQLLIESADIKSTQMNMLV